MFANREEAGRLLGEKLLRYRAKKAVVVLAIPRGGVVVAKVISKILNLPLDLVVVKKIGAPFNPELAIGAVGPEGVVWWDENLISKLKVSKNQRLNMKNQKEKEQKEREKLFTQRKKLSLRNKTVILVDDGVATGATIMAAILWIKSKRIAKIIVAVPIIAADTLSEVKKEVDEIVYLAAPKDFGAVGEFYEEFPQVEDEEVIRILNSK